MAISLASLKKGKEIRPPRGVIYGTRGIGKTSFAAGTLKPLFIFTEEGLGLLEVDRFMFQDNTSPVARSWEEVMEALAFVRSNDLGFRTLVVDSVDWLEQLCHDYVKRTHGEKIFFDYGKGFKVAGDLFSIFVHELDKIRVERNMQILLVGHAKIKRFDAPDVAPFERYMLDLHERAASVIEEWVDYELFATQKVYTTATDVGFGQKLVQGVGSGERVIYTQERPAYSAKNRYNLPHELPLSYAAFKEAMMKAISPPSPPPAQPETKTEAVTVPPATPAAAQPEAVPAV